MLETYHNRLATPPMLGPGEYDMGYVNGGIGHESDQNANSKPSEEDLGPLRELLSLFRHS